MKFSPKAFRAARKDAGLTIEALSKKAGVAISTIFCLEDGRTPSPRVDTLDKLARAIGVEWAVFFAPVNRKSDKTRA